MQMSQLSSNTVARPSRSSRGKYGFGIRVHEFEQIVRTIFDECERDGTIDEANRDNFISHMTDAHSGGNYSHEQSEMILRAFAELEEGKLGSSNQHKHNWTEVK